MSEHPDRPLQQPAWPFPAKPCEAEAGIEPARLPTDPVAHVTQPREEFSQPVAPVNLRLSAPDDIAGNITGDLN